MVEGSPVVFGSSERDSFNIISSVQEVLVFGLKGEDVLTLRGPNTFSLSSNGSRVAYLWGGEGKDTFTQGSLAEGQTKDWVMDFDSRNPLQGGDIIKYVDIFEGNLIAHTWSKDTTALDKRQADENHPFLSDGATYYALQAQSTNGNWYSVLNLVGINGAEITLNELFDNRNLV